MRRSDIALLMAMAAVAGTGPRYKPRKDIAKTVEPDDIEFQKKTIAKAKAKRHRKSFWAGVCEVRTKYGMLKKKGK